MELRLEPKDIKKIVEKHSGCNLKIESQEARIIDIKREYARLCRMLIPTATLVQIGNAVGKSSYGIHYWLNTKFSNEANVLGLRAKCITHVGDLYKRIEEFNYEI